MFTGQALIELSKEKSSLKQAESQTHQFLKTLGHVESKLTEQINYLTQVSTGKKCSIWLSATLWHNVTRCVCVCVCTGYFRRILPYFGRKFLRL